MKSIEIYYDGKWIKANITFLELGINIVNDQINKIILFKDIKKVSKKDNILLLNYLKNVDVSKQYDEIGIKVNKTILNIFGKKFEIIEEDINENKLDKCALKDNYVQNSSFNVFLVIILAILCIVFVIFGININSNKEVLGVYITGKKFMPFLLALICFIILCVIIKNQKKNK